LVIARISLHQGMPSTRESSDRCHTANNNKASTPVAPCSTWPYPHPAPHTRAQAAPLLHLLAARHAVGSLQVAASAAGAARACLSCCSHYLPCLQLPLQALCNAGCVCGEGWRQAGWRQHQEAMGGLPQHPEMSIGKVPAVEDLNPPVLQAVDTHNLAQHA